MNRRPAVLVIAGSDSSGGAGLIRDVQVLDALGVDALCAITAVTAQSDSEVFAVQLLSPGHVRAQISAALSTRSIGAIKIGMLGNQAIVEAVVQCLPSRTTVPIVLDPVLCSSSGTVLLDAGGRQAMRRDLLPRVTVLTPNLPEAAALLDDPVALDAQTQARQLHVLGPEAVLLKGGHATGPEAIDLLVTGENSIHRLTSPRLNATCRGTGCALASALAAGLASGLSLHAACLQAKHYVHTMLASE